MFKCRFRKGQQAGNFFRQLPMKGFYPIFILVVCALSLPLAAAEAKSGKQGRPIETTVFQPAPAKKESGPFLQNLEPYKPIFVLNTWFLNGEGTDKGYQDEELLLQFSFKRRIYWNLYFAYSHKAYWQIYDFGNSRPFREHNYNPELFLEWDDTLRFDHIRLGLIEHESNGEKLRYDKNGQPVNYSRTWNRTYVYVRKAVHPMITLGLKAWVVTDSDDPEDGSFIVDNSDIQQYMGNGEFYAEIGQFPTFITVMLRQGWKTGTETIRVEGRLPLHQIMGWQDQGLDLFIQLFSGYGDSLIDYNRKITRFSLGVAFR